MGRVFRRRKKKNCGPKTTKLGHDILMVNLKKWLVNHGWIPPCLVEVATFPLIGRGIMAIEPIKINDVIARVPLHLVITVSTVSKSSIGVLFSNTCWNPQQVLASFLVWERHLNKQSFWFDYINVLPSDYDSPIYTGELIDLPQVISIKIKDSRMKIKNFYCELLNCCADSVCSHCQQSFKLIFTEEAFFWSWYTVNSRCVYISPSDNMKHSILLTEPDSLALVPYLDLFNHSDTASVKAEVKNNYFQLTTNVPFEKYNQIFIHYGDHNNIKLYLEYGFVIPDNPNDSISLTYEDILSTMDELYPKIYQPSEKKVKYLLSYNLTSDLQMSYDGFSWCALNLINVLLLDENNLHDYSFNVDLSDVRLRDICKYLVKIKYDELNQCLSQVTMYQSSTSRLTYQLITELFKVLNRCKLIY